VKTAEALKERDEGRHLTVRNRDQQRKRTQGNGGSRKNLGATQKRLTRRAIRALGKGQGRKRQGKDKVVLRTQKGWTFGTRSRAKLESITGIRNQGSRRRLHVRSRTTLNETFGKKTELEVAKQIVGTSICLRTMSDWTLCRVRSPQKRKDETTNDRLRAIKLGALTLSELLAAPTGGR
jgi:hypothetical protein